MYHPATENSVGTCKVPSGFNPRRISRVRTPIAGIDSWTGAAVEAGAGVGDADDVGGTEGVRCVRAYDQN